MSKRNFKIIAAIADIHIGIKSIRAETIKTQLKKHFIKVLMDMKHLDGIFILGDIMHTIVSLNSEYAEVFNWFIDKVYKVAKKKNATVIIIKGTLSHDNDQLNNIKHYQNNDDDVDFRIYESVDEFTLWDNYKVLVLPDVRVKELKDIDEKLDKKYDLILGHGTIDAMQFFVQESENQPTKTYVYNVDKLMAASRGPVLFGHVHQYQNVDNKFYYVGPFTLLEHGGTDAGFAVVGIYDKDKTKYKVEHYINPDSANYYEFNIKKKILEEYPVEDIIYTIDEVLKDSKPNDLITLRITRGDSLESADKVIMLETKYRSDRRFSIVKKIKTKKEEQNEAENVKRKEKFAYVMDQSIETPDLMYRYYTDEIKPSLPDQSAPVANITLDDFYRVLDYKHKDGKM